PATPMELTMLPTRLFASGVVAGLIVGLALAGFARERWRPYAFGAALALVPSAALWLLSPGPHSYWMTPYALVSPRRLPVLAAALTNRLKAPAALAALAAVVVALVGIPDQRAIRNVESHDVWNYPEPNPQFFNYSGLAATLAANLQPGDGIVYAERQHFWLAD